MPRDTYSGFCPKEIKTVRLEPRIRLPLPNRGPRTAQIGHSVRAERSRSTANVDACPSTSLKLSELLDLGEGSVVELDRQANELLDILVNGTLVAKGEVVTVNGRFGIRVVDVVANYPARIAGLERRS